MKNFILLIALFLSHITFSQSKMLVFFSDKPESGFTENVLFSPKSIERRNKKSVQLNEYDLPINPSYLSSIGVDGSIEKTSKWLNAIVFSSFLSQEQLLAKYTFIERIIPVNTSLEVHVQKKTPLNSPEKSINYGFATQQIEQLNLNCLHDLGFTGNGIYLAVIDAGFNNMNTVSYFDSVYQNNRVLDSYDFVLNQTSVYANSQHGTMVSSCIVGEKNQGQEMYVGTAKDVDLALYRSENVYSEALIEEFDLVRALERCDSVGVDVANISLGYFNFDDSTTNHVYGDLDGNTTIAALGVNVAVSKGIAVVMAAGNSGPNYISTPCDADDGLCVGAVDEFGNYALFSSVGPNADGQIKPDVASRGQNAFVVTPNDTVVQGNGTSFASPIMCGATACLIQANPTKSVAQIFNAIRLSASQNTFPDSLRGYGIPNFCLANTILNSSAGIAENDLSNLLLYPNPANNELTVYGFEQDLSVEYVIYNSLGGLEKVGKENTSEGYFKINVSTITAGNYFLEIIYEGKVIGKEQLFIVD